MLKLLLIIVLFLLLLPKILKFVCSCFETFK